MFCPACHNSLIIVEYKQIELDYCTQCRGVWFDASELALLLKSMNLNTEAGKFSEILQLPEEGVNEDKRKCPVCRKKMRKVHLGKEPAILVDVCTKKNGIWFDGGEIVQLIKRLATSPDNSKGSGNIVVDFLGEVFQIDKAI